MLIFITLGCGLGDVVVEIDAPACTDWDFSDGEDREPEVSVETTESTVLIERAGVFMDCNARFDPDILAEGGLLVVDERWEGEEGPCCMSPQVLLTMERGGPIEVQWYDPEGKEVYAKELDTRD